MSFSPIVENPFYLLFCVLAAFAFAFFLYRKDSKFRDIAKWKIFAMAIFRFLTVFLISFLLLKPLIKYTHTEIEKPIIIFAQDNSKSILLNNDSLFYKNQYLKKVDSLKGLLSGKYDFVFYSFDDNVQKTDSINFKGSKTDISNLINKISDFYYDRNVGALIIASDGLYNLGQNPVYLKNIDFPIFSVLLGDSAQYPDIAIKNVVYNKLEFLNNNFPLKVDFLAKKLKGKQITINIYNGKNKILSKIENIKTDNQFGSKEFMIKSTKKGLQHYKIEIKTTENESNIKNNYSDAVIDIIDSKQKILIIENSPHPDIAALRKALNSNINFDVDLKTNVDNNFDVSHYNLIILHQLPSLNNSAVRALKTAVIKQIPLLFIIGEQSDVNKIYNLNIGYTLRNKKTKSFDNATPRLNDNFDIFSVDFLDKDFINSLPPLRVPYGNFTNVNKNNVLMQQVIGNVKTSRPLVFFSKQNNTKYCFINGTGIWRWRINNYLQKQNFNLFDNLVNKIVKYLAIKVKKNQFDVEINNFYYNNSQIIISAQVYNSSYELDNKNDVVLEVYNKKNKVYKYKFNKIQDFYKLNLGILPKGDYTYKASVTINGKTYTKQGKFVVFSTNIESLNTRADYKTMFTIADNNKGKLFFAKDLLKLKNEININDNIKPIEKQKNKLNDLLNLKLLFFIIIVLISIEWFYRKYSGAY